MAVDAVRAGLAQGLGQAQVVLVLFVVDAGVKAEFVDDVITLVLAAGNANHAAAAGLGQRAIGTASRTAARNSAGSDPPSCSATGCSTSE